MAHFASYNTSDSSTGNTVLGSNASITPIVMQTQQEGALVGTVKSDQSGQLFVDQSFDGVNWDYTATYSVTGGTGVKISESVIGPFVQIRYTNGATLQTYLRIFARAFGTKTG